MTMRHASFEEGFLNLFEADDVRVRITDSLECGHHWLQLQVFMKDDWITFGSFSEAELDAVIDVLKDADRFLNRK